MNILHSESSPGWGGQEMRILEESKGMRLRGHKVIFVIQKGGQLVSAARKEGFLVYEINFKKYKAFSILCQLIYILKKHRIDLINTHSSMDAWIGGIAARLIKCPILRTRHLSTPVKGGVNSYLLYNFLADVVVTTCQEVAHTLRKQASLCAKRCLSIPTGVNPIKIGIKRNNVEKLRRNWRTESHECLVGTLCVIRSWKGINDLLWAAKDLEYIENLKWIVIGGGVSESYFRQECDRLNLHKKVIFTGHLEDPYEALAALDIFLLLSTAHEGVSQASLQAAWLKKPLITTSVGGLKEVCIPYETGIIVNTHAPKEVAWAVKHLFAQKDLRKEFGKKAHELVIERFTYEKMLDHMEKVYEIIYDNKILRKKPFKNSLL